MKSIYDEELGEVYYQKSPDMAEDEVNAIVGCMEDFLVDLVTLHARNPEIDISELAGLIQDWFHDNLSKKFHENVEVSGAIGYSEGLPTFARLAGKKGVKLPFKVGNRIDAEENAVNNCLMERIRHAE